MYHILYHYYGYCTYKKIQSVVRACGWEVTLGDTDTDSEFRSETETVHFQRELVDSANACSWPSLSEKYSLPPGTWYIFIFLLHSISRRHCKINDIFGDLVSCF